MKITKLAFLGLFFWTAFSCVPSNEEVKMEKLPYYDIKGLLNLELGKLDSATVIKTSRINGKEHTEEVVYSLQDWKEEFEYFYQADINIPSLASSYSTETKSDYLIHRLLPDSKGKVKEITIRYVQNYPASVFFKMKEENIFFTSTTTGEFYISQSSGKLDHYYVETTQKVMFLKPTNIKISGLLK
ncbi:hypothetical protein [Algoriphagus sp. AK58]|uniref:hypothetical protein n=1 Tax=Algoriphagus sp. AK58 TaxID=1406877 RepID=UPI001650759C|nr:hypothetical protein [Algoriphagus sp. AK58]MBC6365376.1 hypothetical protein [Algoriphagus sp. AK58]